MTTDSPAIGASVPDKEPEIRTGFFTADLLIGAAKTLGVSSVILAFIAFGVYKAGTWAGENILLPVTKRHLEFLDETAKTQRETADSVRKSTESQSKQTDILAKQGDTMDRVAKSIEKQAKALEKLNITRDP